MSAIEMIVHCIQLCAGKCNWSELNKQKVQDPLLEISSYYHLSANLLPLQLNSCELWTVVFNACVTAFLPVTGLDKACSWSLPTDWPVQPRQA